MNGAELQLIIRHQAMQLQINDPVSDDFYHHFWVVKGGRSQAKPMVEPTKSVSTERKPVSNAEVGASLGLGAVFSRAPNVSVRTPKPLIVLGGADGDEATAEPTGDATADEIAPTEARVPLSSSTWHLRKQIDRARDTLIELRVRRGLRLLPPHARPPLPRPPQPRSTGTSGCPSRAEAVAGATGVHRSTPPLRK